MTPAMSPDREALIAQYLYLSRVTAIVLIKRMSLAVELEDMVSAGNYGLCKAAREFDFRPGVTFKTFAITCIRGAMLEMLREESHAPRSVLDKVRADRRKSDTGGQNDTEVTVTVSLQAPAEEDAAAMLQDTVPDTAPGPLELALRSARNAALVAAVDRLPEDERFCIVSYYSGGLTHKQIGASLELSASRAYQLWQQGVRRLRGYLQADAELFG